MRTRPKSNNESFFIVQYLEPKLKIVRQGKEAVHLIGSGEHWFAYPVPEVYKTFATAGLGKDQPGS